MGISEGGVGGAGNLTPRRARQFVTYNPPSCYVHQRVFAVQGKVPSVYSSILMGSHALVIIMRDHSSRLPSLGEAPFSAPAWYVHDTGSQSLSWRCQCHDLPWHVRKCRVWELGAVEGFMLNGRIWSCMTADFFFLAIHNLGLRRRLQLLLSTWRFHLAHTLRSKGAWVGEEECS